jgi:hypothetical protein
MNRTIKDATVKRFHYDSHEPTPRPLRRGPQLRPPPQTPARPHAPRIHLQDMGRNARALPCKPAPANAGTKHLIGC